MSTINVYPQPGMSEVEIGRAVATMTRREYRRASADAAYNRRLRDRYLVLGNRDRDSGGQGSAFEFTPEEEARINVRARRIAASREALRRSRELASPLHLPLDRFQQSDDLVKALNDVAARCRGLGGVAGSICDLADELVELIAVHGSPSVGVSTAGTVDDITPTVGAASGVTSFGTPDATPGGAA